MDFKFPQDVLDLRDGARAFLQGVNTPARLRSLAANGDGLALWTKLSEMGFLGAAAPESTGGLGLGVADILLLSEEVGRAGLPEPYSDTAAVLVPTLQAIGTSSDAIVDLVSGKTRGVIAHPLNPVTNFAQGADFVLVFRPGEVVLAEQDAFHVSARDSIDPGRRPGIVTASGGKVVASGPAADELGRDVAARGAAAAAAELCGLAAKMIALATDYSKTREQFGQPIGAFQAVKHLMANAQVQLEFARPVVYRAGATFTGPADARDLAVAHAKVAAGDAAIIAAENAIQVFGGMGYTFEVDLHFFMKRAWALLGVWGDRSHHIRTVDTAVFAADAIVGPGQTFL